MRFVRITRANKKINVPVVMTREETGIVISLLEGAPQLIVKVMYGGGLRISEAICLRIQDIDEKLKSIIIRFGKGGKDRLTTFPATISPFLNF